MGNKTSEYGLAASASFLLRSEQQTLRYAKSGKLPFVRDDNGARKFKLSDLAKLKRELAKRPTYRKRIPVRS